MMDLGTKPLFASLLLVGLGGCQEFYSVDEACDDKLAGGKDLLPADFDAMNRLNCYRRLIGVSKMSANSLINEAAGLTLEYVAANPGVDSFTGDARYQGWLTQESTKPAFSAASVVERISDPVYGAGYEIFDASTKIREYLFVDWNQGELAAPSGEAAIDHLMRDQDFRQVALQPSLVDAAYREIELSGDWFEQGGWSTSFSTPPPSGGRAYYLVVLYTEPHTERTANPVVLPKEEQKQVPLYSFAHRQVSAVDPTRSQLGYGVSFLVGSMDPTVFREADANQYNAFITDFEITGPDGALETVVVHPSGLDNDEEGLGLPDPFRIRSVLSGYTLEALEPSTTYDLYARVVSPDNEDGWEFDYSFTTLSDDPGLNLAAQIGGPGPTTSPTGTGTTGTGTGTGTGTSTTTTP